MQLWSWFRDKGRKRRAYIDLIEEVAARRIRDDGVYVFKDQKAGRHIPGLLEDTSDAVSAFCGLDIETRDRKTIASEKRIHQRLNGDSFSIPGWSYRVIVVSFIPNLAAHKLLKRFDPRKGSLTIEDDSSLPRYPEILVNVATIEELMHQPCDLFFHLLIQDYVVPTRSLDLLIQSSAPEPVAVVNIHPLIPWWGWDLPFPNCHDQLIGLAIA